MIGLSVLAALAITLSPPRPVAEIDAGKLKGDLMRLAWSDEGSEFYLQTVERDRSGQPKAIHHYIVSAAKALKDVAQEPAWAAKYWQWKSAQASPAASTFKIGVAERSETRRAASAPTGGVLARGGTADPTAGTTFTDVAAAADASQTVRIFALSVGSEIIGEWTNEAVTPGTNFSWAPAPLRLLAFAKRDGGPIVVLDSTGQKQELAGPKAAVLPAWSADGKKLAWLERMDRRKYQLTVADISIP